MDEDEILIIADELGFTIRHLLMKFESLVEQNRHRDAGEVLAHISILTQQMHAIENKPTWYDGDIKVDIGMAGKELIAAINADESPF